MADDKKRDEGGWVLLHTYSNLQEAEIDRGLLADNGIPCVIQNEAISSVYPMTDTWTPLNMMVPAAFADEAASLLGGGDGAV